MTTDYDYYVTRRSCVTLVVKMNYTLKLFFFGGIVFNKRSQRSVCLVLI